MLEDKKHLRVVGCFVELEGKLLMLLRSKSETDPSLWGIPAGKAEPGESDTNTILRELYEETGLQFKAQDLRHLGELPIEYPTVTVDFPVFQVTLPQMPVIVLAPQEHIDHAWIEPQHIIKLPNLMQDVDTLLKTFGYLGEQ